MDLNAEQTARLHGPGQSSSHVRVPSRAVHGRVVLRRVVVTIAAPLQSCGFFALHRRSHVTLLSLSSFSLNVKKTANLQFCCVSVALATVGGASRCSSFLLFTRYPIAAVGEPLPLSHRRCFSCLLALALVAFLLPFPPVRGQGWRS